MPGFATPGDEAAHHNHNPSSANTRLSVSTRFMVADSFLRSHGDAAAKSALQPATQTRPLSGRGGQQTVLHRVLY